MICDLIQLRLRRKLPPRALQCSTTDEWFFTISPVFGSDVVGLQRANASELGFGVSGGALAAYGPGNVPPSTNCTQQSIQQSQGSPTSTTAPPLPPVG